MATRLDTHLNTQSVNVPVPGKDQVKNEAGGYVFEASELAQLERFLLFGANPNMYQTKEDLVNSVLNSLLHLVQKDSATVWLRTVNASNVRKVPNNDPSLFVTALLLAHGDLETKKVIAKNLSVVARTGTHLFRFINYLKTFRGMGVLARKAIRNWYLEKDAEGILFQGLKYRSRDGWTHRDALRVAHPKSSESLQNLALAYLAGKGWPQVVAKPTCLQAFEELQAAETPKQVGDLVSQYGKNAPHEFIPKHLLNNREVWEPLAERMPPHALLRNLPKLSELGILDGKKNSADVCQRLIEGAARVHPASYFIAYGGYRTGATRSGIRFTPNPDITEALLQGFKIGFGRLPQSEKRVQIALDHSSSMLSALISDTSNVSAWEASVAMAMILWKQFPNASFVRFGTSIQDIDFKVDENNLLKTLQMHSWRVGEGTNCALPVEKALRDGVRYDGFLQMTDNMSWVGNHSFSALKKYRQQVNPMARQIILAMCSNKYSIADPTDPFCADISGFDSNTPILVSDFLEI